MENLQMLYAKGLTEDGDLLSIITGEQVELSTITFFRIC